MALIFAMSHLVACKHYPPDVDNLVPASGSTVGPSTPLEFQGPCDTDSVYFNNSILPLFISNCAKSGCHDAITSKEGFTFNSYANIMASGEIVPNDPTEGDIMEVIKSSQSNKRMPPPPNIPLSQQQIDLIEKWIKQGAQNNGCDNCDSTAATYTAKIKPLLDAKCKGCHNANYTSYGVSFETYGTTVAVGQTGQLLGAVKHISPYKFMPKGGPKLRDCEISMIENWINNSYPQ